MEQVVCARHIPGTCLGAEGLGPSDSELEAAQHYHAPSGTLWPAGAVPHPPLS